MYQEVVMKHMLLRSLALAGALLAVSDPGMAEVQRIKIDVAGYLCGL
jgi:hypothetical protein